MVVLLSTNIDSFDLATLKTIAFQVCELDLSSSKKSRCEPIVALTRMKERVQGENVLQYSQRIQKHFFFSFAISIPCTETFLLLETFEHVHSTCWDCDRDSDLVIASGLLGSWVQTITIFSDVDVSPTILRILNMIQDKIESYGLSSLFKNYRKEATKEGNYYLIKYQ
jgi:hypothetical protein